MRRPICLLVLGLAALSCSIGDEPESATESTVDSPVVEQELRSTPEPADATPSAPSLPQPESPAPDVEPTSVAEPATPVPPTPVPATAVPPTALPPTPTAVPLLVGGTCAVPPRNELDPNRPRYVMELDVDLPAALVVGRSTITFTPDLEIEELVFRLFPNGPRPAAAGNALEIERLSVDGVEHSVELTTPTIAVVPLEEIQPAGSAMEIDLEFRFALGTPNRGRMAATPDWARFGSAFPMLPWEPGVGWATEPATSGFSETVASPAADFDVTVDLIGERAGSDPVLTVLATGVETEPGRWTSEGTRDFAVSIGDFEVVEAIANAPDPVRVIVARHRSVPDDPASYLDRIVSSLESYADRWGAYPWPSLSVALTPELRGGIEFPMHIMQGAGSVGRTTPHEVAHQWFYAMVGNNQGRDPWLDEGLASYGEFVFEGTTRADIGVPADLVGLAGEPMTFWEERFSGYYVAVYTQTALALLDTASIEQVDCALAQYVAANAWRIATPADFAAATEGWIDPAHPALVLAGIEINPEG